MNIGRVSSRKQNSTIVTVVGCCPVGPGGIRHYCAQKQEVKVTAKIKTILQDPLYPTRFLYVLQSARGVEPYYEEVWEETLIDEAAKGFRCAIDLPGSQTTKSSSDTDIYLLPTTRQKPKEFPPLPHKLWHVREQISKREAVIKFSRRTVAAPFLLLIRELVQKMHAILLALDGLP